MIIYPFFRLFRFFEYVLESLCSTVSHAGNGGKVDVY